MESYWPWSAELARFVRIRKIGLVVRILAGKWRAIKDAGCGDERGAEQSLDLDSLSVVERRIFDKLNNAVLRHDARRSF